MMQPVRFAIIRRAARWEHIKVPFRLTESTLSHSASAISRNGPSKPYAGVVDQNVDATEFILHDREQPVYVRGRGNIGFYSQNLSADMLLRSLGYLLGAFFVDVGNDEVRASAGERFGNSGANASARPSYDSSLPLRSMTASDLDSTDLSYRFQPLFILKSDS